jgi:hypothetical protein
MERRGMSVPVQIAIGLVIGAIILLSPSIHIGHYTFGKMPPSDTALDAWVKQNYKVSLPKVIRAGNSIEISGYSPGFAANPFGVPTLAPPFAQMGYQKPGPISVSVGSTGIGLAITLLAIWIGFDLIRRLWNALQTRLQDGTARN